MKQLFVTIAGATFLLSNAAVAREPIVVVERAIGETLVDTRDGVAVVGTRNIFANPIYDATNTVQIGSDADVCTLAVPGKLWSCAWTVVFKSGRLMVSGLVTEGETSKLAITGGTEEFRGARGILTVIARSGDQPGYDFRFEFD